MKRHFNFCLRFVFSLFLLTAPMGIAGMAQEVFEDPEGNYTVSLPAGWLGIVSRDGLGRTDVNIVFKNRENGALKIRRIDDVDPKMDVMQYATKDESDRVRFVTAYDKLGMEKFLLGGSKVGALLSYDYKNPAGQPFTGRFYYLQTDEKTIYILQFTGRRNILGTLRSHTDAIARSFKTK